MVRYHPHHLIFDTHISFPTRPINGSSRTTGSYTGGDAYWASNLVALLAFMLLCFIFALGLKSFLRSTCGAHFSLWFRMEALEQLATTAGGYKNAASSQIPMVVYKSRLNMSSAATDCPICLAEFERGERVKILPRCHHGFHAKCIDAWLDSHSSCPTCRQLLFQHPTSANAQTP